VNHSWTFAIDRGGTFTDVVARASGGRVRVEKLDVFPDSTSAGVEIERRQGN